MGKQQDNEAQGADVAKELAEAQAAAKKQAEALDAANAKVTDLEGKLDEANKRADAAVAATAEQETRANEAEAKAKELEADNTKLADANKTLQAQLDEAGAEGEDESPKAKRGEVAEHCKPDYNGPLDAVQAQERHAHLAKLKKEQNEAEGNDTKTK